MTKLKLADFKGEFLNNNDCLELLKSKLYPYGIKCPRCNRVTGHYRVSSRPYYACNNCRHQISLTRGTIFYKSSTPLRTWFAVIQRISEARGQISIKDIQRDYSITYKTAWRMVHKINESMIKNKSKVSLKRKNPGYELTVTKPNLTMDRIQQENRHLKCQGQVRSIIGGSELQEDTSDVDVKSDRIARLLKLQMLLCQYPHGLRINEIASKCSVSKRTVYRDLKDLDSKLKVPIWQDDNKRGIAEGYFLPPINFTLEEAVDILMALRTTQSVNHMYIPSWASTFMKLNTIVPMPLKQQIVNTLEYMRKLPFNEKRVRNFKRLIEAWFSAHKVRLIYQCPGEIKPVERIIETYFIEPSLSVIGGSSYLIGYCNFKKSMYAFRISRIIGEVEIEPETYIVPGDFNIIDYLNEGFGIRSDDKDIETVKLHIKSPKSKILQENIFHSSQMVETQSDGSAIVTLKVRDSSFFRHLILGWGDQVEILEPKKFRDEIKTLAKSLLDIYSH